MHCSLIEGHGFHSGIELGMHSAFVSVILEPKILPESCYCNLLLCPYCLQFLLFSPLPGLSDHRPSLIVAHGLLFGSFLPNRSPWASIWRKHCYDELERNCQIKAHGLVFRKPGAGDMLPNGQSKIIVGKIIAIQVAKKHRTSNTLQILLYPFTFLCTKLKTLQNFLRIWEVFWVSLYLLHILQRCTQQVFSNHVLCCHISQ